MLILPRFLCKNEDLLVGEGHALPVPHLVPLSQFHMAIDAYRTGGDHVLTLTAARAQSRQFQKMVQFDEVASECEMDGFHEGAVGWVSAKIAVHVTLVGGPAYHGLSK